MESETGLERRKGKPGIGPVPMWPLWPACPPGSSVFARVACLFVWKEGRWGLQAKQLVRLRFVWPRVVDGIEQIASIALWLFLQIVAGYVCALSRVTFLARARLHHKARRYGGTGDLNNRSARLKKTSGWCCRSCFHLCFRFLQTFSPIESVCKCKMYIRIAVAYCSRFCLSLLTICGLYCEYYSCLCLVIKIHETIVDILQE